MRPTVKAVQPLLMMTPDQDLEFTSSFCQAGANLESTTYAASRRRYASWDKSRHRLTILRTNTPDTNDMADSADHGLSAPETSFSKRRNCFGESDSRKRTDTNSDQQAQSFMSHSRLMASGKGGSCSKTCQRTVDAWPCS